MAILSKKSPEEKLQVVLSVFRGELSVAAQVCQSATAASLPARSGLAARSRGVSLSVQAHSSSFDQSALDAGSRRSKRRR